MKLQTGSGAALTVSPPDDIVAEDRLHKIAHLLGKKATSTSNLQLAMGQTGIALFLFHYYSFTKNEDHYNMAHALLDQIYESVSDPAVSVHRSAPIHLGWLFMYLQSHDFIDIDTDDVLAATDSAMVSTCMNESLKYISDEYVTDIGAYLVLRYGCTSYPLKKLKIEEALICLVDEIRRLYPGEIKEKFSSLLLHEPINEGIAFHRFIRETCNLCILLSKIAGLGIYKQVVTDTITDIYETVLLPVLSKQPLYKSVSNNYPGYATLAYTVFTQALITPYIKNGTENNYYEFIHPNKNPSIYAKEQTPYIGDLLLTIACLRNLNSITPNAIDAAYLHRLSEKLYASAGKNAPGYIDSPIGIPDLGLQDGIAGTGMALLQALKDELLVNEDILLMTIK